MRKITLPVPSDDAEQILRAALENYAVVQEAIATMARTRELHAGETRERLERRAQVHDKRAVHARAMAASIPGGQAGPNTNGGNTR